MELKVKTFGELNTHELYEIARARTEIFLMEQKIICRDLDGIDYDSLHCFLEEDGQIKAYLRAYVTDAKEKTVKIGRVLSITHGIGLGTRLMKESIAEIKKRTCCKKIVVNAQKHAQKFYESIGFATVSDDFLEEGIVHIAMELQTP